ncbi:MAG: hypothetical protein QN720_05035 [Nitrososphaeraceae archaeon]|nr:hypothetical protein [Nitrososphaeraceae archaeon]MDW0332312.1 hypothetical protein [Nitrososphaeraceae archaeon]
MLALFKYTSMETTRELKFALQLQLSESYIYGTATLDEKDYSINIQQAANQLVVLPQDFSYIGEIDKGLISFSRENDNNNKRISIASEIQVGQGDLIEVYLDQDNILLSIANDLPIEISILVNATSIINTIKGR